MSASIRSSLILSLVVLTAGAAAPRARATGSIDAATVVSAPHGTFNGVEYVRYEAMFAGITSNNRPYRVPCQIIAPSNPGDGSGLLLFDWLVPSTIPTAVGQEQADARYGLTDGFLFGAGASYATVRCDQAGLGKESPIVSLSRPWSDDLLDTSSEFIQSAGDEFDIVVDYVKALRTDPVALQALGTVQRRAAFGYSASGFRLRGLLRLKQGRGLFDFSLVGGTGAGYYHPAGNSVAFSNAEKAPLSGAGLEIDVQSECDVVALGAHKARHQAANYRTYQIAGAAHIRDVDVVEFGLQDPELANPADFVPFLRTFFAAGYAWCDGVEPPPTLWLGAPNDPKITRDAKGNALVTHVGGLPLSTSAYRLPEVAVGENQYFPFDPAYDDGSLPGLLRALAGGRVDLTGQFTDHAAYVQQIAAHALVLQGQGYLLEADAAAIIEDALLSDIGT